MPPDPTPNSYQDYSQHNTSYGTYANYGVHVSGHGTAQIYHNALDDLDRLNPASSAGIFALDQDGCMAGTRISLLKDLKHWSEDVTTHRVCWLDGMAGTGKSAIARSFSRLLHQNQRLGGSFFCIRGHESRANAKRILPTLAWFLARQDLHYRESLRRMVQDAPDVVDYSLERQFEFLFETPFREGTQITGPPLVLVIDALDECADSAAVTQLLKSLLSIADTLPIKFFVTSRPERHIMPHFKSPQSRILRLGDIEQDVVYNDISLYLKNRLEDIRSSSDDSSMFPGDWPPPRDVEILTRRADKLFIYAFTAVEYIRDDHPVNRLQSLTGLTMAAGQSFHGDLDNMYSLVLSAALDMKKRREEEIRMTKQVLGVIFTLREPLCLSDLATLLGVRTHVIRVNIDRIRAVISVPPPEKDGVVSVFHASLVDFLTTPGRAPDEMRITLSAAHQDLADRCLQIMDSKLCFNIAECKTSYLPNSEQTFATIPAPLQYSCLHWAHHIAAADDPVSLLVHLEMLLLEKFLFWLEVLSVTGTVSLASSIIMRAALTAEMTTRRMMNLVSFLHEANDFALVFREAIELSVAHIYLSALPSVRRTKIAEAFNSKYPSTVKVTADGVEEPQKVLLELQGHESSVECVGFSPDGTHIVSGSEDKTIRLWDARTGEEVVKPLKGHTDGVKSVGFSPDGTRIVSGSSDYTIRIWDVRTGEEVIKPLIGHTDGVRSVGFSPDGTRIASGSNDMTIRVWDTRTGEEVIKPLEGHTDEVLSVGFSPDGTRIVSGSWDKTIRIWDVRTGEEVVKPLEAHTWVVSSVSFSPDGTHIVSGACDHTIRIWDVRTGEEVVMPLTEPDGVWSVGFSPDGMHIVSGSMDKKIRIWDARTGEEVVKPFIGHTDGVMSVAFSPDGTRIVSGSEDKTIRIWDTRTVEVVKPLEADINCVESVGFSPDGKRIVLGSNDHTIRIWDARTGEEVVKPLIGHTESVESVGFSPDGTRIVSGSFDNTIRIWDARTGEEVVKPLIGHTDGVRSVGFSPDGTRIVSGSEDQTIRIWDARTGEVVKPLKGHTNNVFSPDGTRNVLGSWDKMIQIWNGRTSDEVVKPFKGHTKAVMSVGFSPDGTRIVSGSCDYTIRIWDARTGEEVVKPLKGHTQIVRSVSFSPDGTRIVSGSWDKTIRIWDARTGEEVMKPLKPTDAVLSVCFSPDGTRIASGSWDKTIRIWDARTGEEVVKPFKGHTKTVRSVGFSPDGRHIVSGSDDKTIRIWDARTDDEVVTESVHAQPDLAHSVAFAPDSSSPIVSKNSHSLLRFHPFRSSQLNKDGWIRGPTGELIFWVLPQWRSVIVLPPCILVVGTSRVLCDTRRYVHGTEWMSCRSS